MADPGNTISSFTGRNRYFAATMQQVLQNFMPSDKILDVRYDTPTSTIQNPYGGQPTATISANTGTYTVSDFTTTNDELSITDEFKYAEQVYKWNDFVSNFDLISERFKQLSYAVAYGLDNWAVNNLAEDGTGSYTTPTGGFTTASNIITIMANLNSKVAGYAQSYNGLFLVIENTDMVGFEIAQATSGYSMADSVLNNGFYRHFMGVDIYVVRSGYFVTSTLGTKTVSNASHRVYGVKKMATLAVSPMNYDEKQVGGRTGKEISVHCNAGIKLWTQNATLIVDITIA